MWKNSKNSKKCEQKIYKYMKKSHNIKIHKKIQKMWKSSKNVKKFQKCEKVPKMWKNIIPTNETKFFVKKFLVFPKLGCTRIKNGRIRVLLFPCQKCPAKIDYVFFPKKLQFSQIAQKCSENCPENVKNIANSTQTFGKKYPKNFKKVLTQTY